MFKKLLANLPFNSNLLDDVAFYANRLHREAALRRTGLFFLSLALAVQGMAVLYPSSSSLVEATGAHPLATSHNQGEAKLELSKTVENLTQKFWDANRSTASGGDELEFKLITKNA